MSCLRHVWSGLLASVALVTLIAAPKIAQAKYIGGDPPLCPECLSRLKSSNNSGVSLTEGNATESYPVTTVRSSTGPTISLTLTYNSYNADGSRAAIDSGIGYGWTHTYNDLLFNQRGDMFRMDGVGRITRFALVGNGVYQTSTGYFETLEQNLDGTFTLTDKFKTMYHYTSVPGTAFEIAGPVCRLDTITDRVGNLTKMSYSSGDLVSTTDTYGRSIKYSYDTRHHLIGVIDPLGRATTLTYDSTDRQLTSITDANLKTTRYTYDILYQITSKTDGDSRVLIYGYQHSLPATARDGTGASIYSLSNPSEWATDPNQLAMDLMRVYVSSSTTFTDGRGHAWTYGYDSHGYPTSIVAPDGSTTTYAFDSGTLLVSSKTDANGHVTNYTYDSRGNQLTATDALGHTTTFTYEPVFNQVTSMTDPNGRLTTYTYDSHGNRLSATDPLGGTETWTYDPHGNVLSHSDKRGNTTQYVYDSSGDLIQTTDPLGNVTTSTFDAVGNQTSVTNALGRVTQYQYDRLNRQIKVTDALGGPVTSSYDDVGNKTERTDQNGNTTQYQFDQRNRLAMVIDGLGKATTATYDANNNRISRTDRDGHTTKYFYDSLNRLIRTTDALGHSATTTYDPAGNVASKTDANGHKTTYLYDALNRKIQMTDALGDVTAYGYDLIGTSVCNPCSGPTLGSSKITKLTDANGKVTYYTYDGLDRLILQIRKQGGITFVITFSDAVTAYTYDAMSNRLRMTEPDGNTTAYSYDALNRQIKMVNAAGDTTTWTYDPVGNVSCRTDPNSNVVCYSYDVLNRQVKEMDSEGLVQTTLYDPVGNVLSRLDGNRNGPTNAYDADNRIVMVSDSLAKTTRYRFDPEGNLLSVTDRNGNVISFLYDAINRRIAMTDAQQATTQYQYDNVGNLIKLNDASGHSTVYTYDSASRLISEKYPDLLHDTVTYAYDAVGNRLKRTDQKGQTTTYTYSDLYFLLQRSYPFSPADVFTYDLAGRVLSATRGSWGETFAYDGANRTIQSVQNGRTISYVYNIPAGIRTVTYPGGRSITDQMDFRGRLSTVNDGGITPIAQYTYDAAERELTRTYRNGTEAGYTYNANNWVLSLTHTKDANLIVGFNYTYDDEGNKAYEKKLHETTHSEGYSYDNVYRLIDYKVGTLVGSTINMVITQTAYDLDLLGNWDSKRTDGVIQTRTHGPSNEITSIDATPILSDYDGNTSDDGARLYAYDEENRLVKVSTKSTHAVLGEYQYDAFGRRISKIDNFGVATLYYYDGWRTLEEQSSTGMTEATYVFGNHLDEALTMTRSGANYYYHQNTLRSIFALSDTAGKGIEGYSYDAYGHETVILPGHDGSLDFDSDDVYLPGGKSSYGNPFLFTGQRLDPETGLMYYKHRYESTSLGRFLSRDPLGYRAGDMNLYEYVKGRPTFATDPSGELIACECVSGSAALVVAISGSFCSCTDNCVPAGSGYAICGGGGIGCKASISAVVLVSPGCFTAGWTGQLSASGSLGPVSGQASAGTGGPSGGGGVGLGAGIAATLEGCRAW